MKTVNDANALLSGWSDSRALFFHETLAALKLFSARTITRFASNDVWPLAVFHRPQAVTDEPGMLSVPHQQLLAMEDERDPLQYHHAFVRMYGPEAMEAASAAISLRGKD
jgi:hypothetical protein